MRVATCTPIDFDASPQFFGRDSGLMCRGFQAAGHECTVIMPGSPTADDAPDLQRATYTELTSSAWWRALDIEIVLLYAWGDPAHFSVAKAIRDAGIFLVHNLDLGGIDSPYVNLTIWARSLGSMLRGPKPLLNRARLLARAGRDFLPFVYEKKRLEMMDEGNLVAAVSPAAAESIRRYANALGRPSVADKVITVPHPVSPEFTYKGEPKQNRVVSVGRWLASDHHQKDPETLIQVALGFLRSHHDWEFEVIGNGATALSLLVPETPKSERMRLILTERLERDELLAHYRKSRILLCPSRFESFHISSAEALCSGCSIVVVDHPLLASTGWFTTRDSGTLAASREPSDMIAALHLEVTAWETGKRSAQAISSTWSTDLHASCVASHLIQSITQAH